MVLMLAAAVAKHLDGLGIVTYREDQAGGDCFLADVPSEPDEVVVITPTGGFVVGNKHPDDMPTFQVRGRGKRFKSKASYERMRRIYSALAALDRITLDPGGDDEIRVQGITPLQSDPVSMGMDANQRHEWVINFRADTHAPTLNRAY